MAKKKTIYSVYKEDASRRKLENTLPEFYPNLPKKKFDVIYADPPWDYNGKMQFDRSGLTAENGDLSRSVFISAATFKYPTVKTAELKKMPIEQIAKEDCLLFMWATSPHLEQAIELGNAWGFDYKTVAFVWDKMNHNPGQYTLSGTELCLVFKRGRIPRPRGTRNERQLVKSPRRDHSQKPDEVIEAISRMFPEQDKIELFARRPFKGWKTWGLDLVLDSYKAFPEVQKSKMKNGKEDSLKLDLLFDEED